jgi:hypothetical protein
MPISVYRNKRRLAEIADETPVYLRFGDAYMQVKPCDVELDADDDICIDCSKFVAKLTKGGQVSAYLKKT